MSAPPVIGISPNDQPPELRTRGYRGKTLEYSDQAMAEAIVRAGGLPMILCRGRATAAAALADLADASVAHIDGLLLTGGHDVDPGTYGQPAARAQWPGQPDRDRWELALYRAALAERRPILGICRGCQLINVAEGGTLWPDLPSAGPAAEGSAAAIHRSEAIYDQLMHSLDVVPGSEVATLWDGAPARVNSVHHQGLREVGIGLRVTARAPDGLPEAVERPGGPWVLGVQWHPEWMTGDLQQERLFERFVRRAGEGR